MGINRGGSMQVFLTAVGLIAYGLGVWVARHIASDIQIILVAVLLLGGTILLGVAAVLGRLGTTGR